MERQPRTQDISWVLDLNSRKQLDLDPPYQRRSVWTRKDREYFIDTIFKNYPSPAIFLHRTIDEQGKATYHVVDVKQRLQTILLFSENKLRVPQTFGDENLNGKKFADLGPTDRQRFWNYSLLVEFLPTADPTVVNNVFERVNRNSRKLTAQELRHAKYDGWFSQFIEDQTSQDEWVQLGVVTKARSKRMSDAQFLSELLAVILKNGIQGFDQDALDAIYAEFDDPDEAQNATITTDDAEDRFHALRTLISGMVASSPEVKAHLKTVTNFYSLWGYLHSCEPLPTADGIAPKYAQFMGRVDEFLDHPELQPRTDAADRAVDLAAQKYAQNSTGASTDAPARKARGESLAAGIAALS
jgi:hypothetical protein